LHCIGFSEDPARRLTFVEVPSRLKWGFHTQAHNLAVGVAPGIPVGRNVRTTLGFLRKSATDSAVDAWLSLFRNPDYAGSQFLHLRGELTDRNTLVPAYANGGTWCKRVHRISEFSRLVRGITGHAPIEAYRSRFHPRLPREGCPRCDCPTESRLHVLVGCPEYSREQFRDMGDLTLESLIEFLRENPLAFSFGNLPPGG